MPRPRARGSSGVGDDVNPCSRTAPCKTFAGAISKTATRGQINVLDPGGFGTVTITKAMTIVGIPGASILAALSPHGILVNLAGGPTPNGRVVIRNLDIAGVGTGTTGIRFLSGGQLIVERVTISDFVANGIGMPWNGAAGTNGRLYVRHSEIDANGAGINIFPVTAGTTARVSITDTILDDNGIGLQANAAANGAMRISARNCEISGNSTGVFAAEWITNITDCLIAGNGTGLLSAAGGLMRVSASTITDNDTGVNPGAGQIFSRGNNTLMDNVSQGAFTGTFGPA